MIRRYVSIFLILIFIRGISAQSLDIKMRRLEHIQDMIEQKRKEMEKTHEELDLLSRDKDNYEHQYQTTMNKINTLTAREREISQTLTESQKAKENSQSRLEATGDLWQKQIYNFYKTSQTSNKSRDYIVENHYFPIMICQTKEIIDENKELLALVHKNIEESQRAQQRLRTEKNRENQIVSGYRSEITKLSDKITILETEEQEIQREFANLLQSRQNLENLINHFQTEQEGAHFTYQFTTNKLLWPIRGEVINPFGEVRDKLHNVTLLNNGIDIVCDHPQEVKAVDFGVVVFAELFGNYGRLIIIDHQNGYFSLYGNNSNLLVTKDDLVSLGQPIAIAGKRSNSEYYLLHFEIRRQNTPVNPLTYLE